MIGITRALKVTNNLKH